MPRSITNRYNLPDPVLNAVKHDGHINAGNLSVTQLLDSPRVRILKSKHQYEEDVSDMLEALHGTAMHGILQYSVPNGKTKQAFMLTMQELLDKLKKITDEEKKEGLRKVIEYLKKYHDMVLTGNDRYLVEQTLRTEIDGVVLYGTFDLYDTLTNSLEDYKNWKTAKWRFEESRILAKQQLNVYAYLAMVNGFKVDNLFINAFFKDWSNSVAFKSKDYPPHKIMRIPVKLGTPDQILAFIKDRIRIHKEAEENLPLCTGSERWAKADEYVIKTPGVRRAVKKCGDNPHLAQQWITENKHRVPKAFIEKRPGDSQRCASYCPVAQFCTQRQEELVKQKEEADQK